MNEAIMRALGFGKDVEKVKAGFCPQCEKPACMEEFKDELSRKEYKIGGMCQACQDKFFE